ncbi:mandelate racemase/muconate lactonizing enzyme family protein [Paenibacillus solisilvae]|uniref:Mandelate racemase/muconate lactonizing enzyme family protein n=1 Tax=Paenibacillus solisilvae TaxID=2486751 RepID=A0ABW0VWS8_9BACL
MLISEVNVYPLEIPFRGEFHISRGKVGGGSAKRTVVLVKMTDEDGNVGWGEGSPSYLWSSETIESVVSTLRNYLIPAIIGAPVDDIDGLHQRMERATGPAVSTAHPIAKCALDTALHDLIGHKRGLNIAQLIGYQRADSVAMSWTVSAKSLEKAEDAIREGLDAGYAHFNVKLGVEPRYDVQLCELVKKLAPNSFLWGDANGGYTLAQASRLITSLEDAGLDLMEQPFPSNHWSAWREFKWRTSIPLGADEPILCSRDLIEWVRQDLIDVYVAKVTRTGGLFPARLSLEFAEHAGLTTVFSGLTETSVGLAAHLQLACAFGNPLPCAWNGPQFLADDVTVDRLHVENGRLKLPSGPGLGVTIDEEKVSYYSVEK